MATKKIPVISEETTEKNRIRARNAYRLKQGIPLDIDLIQCGGAHRVKYASKEEAKRGHCEQQKLRYVEKREEILEYHKQYKIDHKEKFLKYQKKYRAERKAKLLSVIVPIVEQETIVEQEIYANKMTRKEYNSYYYLQNKNKMNEQGKKNYIRKKVILDALKIIPETLTISQITNDLDALKLIPETLTISQITNDLDDYMKKYKMSFNI